MIVNSPTKGNFEVVAKENLTQAFTLLYKVYEHYGYYDDDAIHDEVPFDDVWEHHSGTLRTTLILLHQAIESLMKSAICQTSPLLLIDKPRKEWPTLPDSDDRDFDSLYTLGGESLLRTFCAVDSNVPRTTQLINFIEDIRQRRNKAIHGASALDIAPKYIVENILRTFTIWFGPDTWHQELINNIVDNPLYGYFDTDYEASISYKFLDFALLIIGKSALSKHISVDITGRPYFCPNCKHNIEKEHDSMKSKWAFLRPNQPDSTTIACVNCHESLPVIRNKCDTGDCKGNVLYEDVDYYGGLACLTCFATHEYPND